MSEFEYYERDGKKYERYSTVAGFFAHPWLVKYKLSQLKKSSYIDGDVVKFKSDKRAALSIGTKVHKLVEDNFHHGSYKLGKSNESVINCMKAWDRWRDDYNLDILTMEQVVYSDTLGVAGTYDFRTIDTMGDIKTSMCISEDYWIQVAFYNMVSGLNLPKLGILRLDKTIGEYEWVVRENKPEYFERFLDMLRLFNYYKKEEKWDGYYITEDEE